MLFVFIQKIKSILSNKLKFKTLFAISSILILCFFILRTDSDSKHTISVFYSYSAESTDPLDFDMGVHHLTMRSLYSSLVSEYTAGKISPDIALDWSSTSNFKIWSFKIDSSRKFESGDSISSKLVALSINRIAFLMKTRGSRSGLIEYLQGIDNISSPGKLIDGISYDSQYLYLKFQKPMPKLINKLAFGLYGIVHPDDYDQINGAWKDKRKINSSGHYRILSWINDSMSIVIKPEFKDQGRFDRINFSFKNFVENYKYDMIVASSESDLSSLGYIFTSRVKSKIRYVECMNWKDAASFCHLKVNRIMMRNHLYTHLEKSGLRPTLSFFPLSIEGIAEFKTDKTFVNPSLSDKKYRISYVLKKFTSGNSESRQKVNYTARIYEAFDSFAISKGLNINRVSDADVSTFKLSNVDFKLDITSILLDATREDIQFMFNSKEGISLPDIDGSISRVLSENEFNIQHVNSLIWEQAVVWPINHLAFGSWIKEKSNINLSRINNDLLPADFWWVFKKNENLF